MLVAKLENSAVVEYPVQIPVLIQRLQVAQDELTEELLNAHGYALVTLDFPNDFHPDYHVQRLDSFDVIENRVVARFSRVEKPLDEIKTAALAKIDAYWYEQEIGGIELMGQKILTDRESQALISGACIKAMMRSPDVVFDFKAASGWITLNADQILAIGDAVAQHVQDCFTQRRLQYEEIAACTTLEEIRHVYDR